MSIVGGRPPLGTGPVYNRELTVENVSNLNWLCIASPIRLLISRKIGITSQFYQVQLNTFSLHFKLHHLSLASTSKHFIHCHCSSFVPAFVPVIVCSSILWCNTM